MPCGCSLHSLLLALLVSVSWAEELTQSVIDADCTEASVFSSRMNLVRSSEFDERAANLPFGSNAVVEELDPTDDLDDYVQIEFLDTDLFNLKQFSILSVRRLCHSFQFSHEQARHVFVCQFLC
jgi:hypothetical protein